MSVDRTMPYVIGISFDVVVVVIVIVLAISCFLKRHDGQNSKPGNRSSFYAGESVHAHTSDEDASRSSFGALPPQTVAPPGATCNGLTLANGRDRTWWDVPRAPSLRTVAANVVGSPPHDSADIPAVSTTAQRESAYIEIIQKILAPIFGPQVEEEGRDKASAGDLGRI